MLEEQNEFLLRDLKSVEESYGTDALTLTVSSGYLERLLSNPRLSDIWSDTTSIFSTLCEAAV